jgi:uncharacterized membrane-anchored protein YjiN (DUF445 family)
MTPEHRREYARLIAKHAVCKVRSSEAMEEYKKAVRREIAASDDISSFLQETKNNYATIMEDSPSSDS